MREGYKKTELGVIPEDWEVKRLEEISEIVMGQSPLSESYNEIGEGLPLIQGNADCKNRKTFPRIHTSQITKECSVGDIIMTVRAPVGAISKSLHDACIGRGVCAIKSKKNHSSEFLYQYLVSFEDGWESLAQGSTFTAVNSKDVRTVIIPVPPLKEQEKIASILSSVDDHIEEIDSIIEDLKLLKKGLMQKLLTGQYTIEDGKLTKTKEFKKTSLGKLSKDWEVKTLEDISIGKGSYGIGASAKKYRIGQPRYLRISDIDENGRLLRCEIKGLEDQDYKEYLLEENDIVFARTGNTTGKSYLYNKKDGDLVYAGFLIRFKIDDEIMDSKFVKYYCQTQKYLNWVSVMSVRSGQPGINSKEYSILEVPIPPLKEQEKISSILSSLDNRIETYQSENQDLKQLKKGLMQELLTGKTRVKVDGVG